MHKRWKLVLATAIVMGGCSKKQAPVAPGEAYGCNEFFDGSLQQCVELSSEALEPERLLFGKDCMSSKVKGKLTGQPVKHCPDADIVARCTYPDGKLTGRLYKDASEQSLRGAELGCKMRGGTFTR